MVEPEPMENVKAGSKIWELPHKVEITEATKLDETEYKKYREKERKTKDKTLGNTYIYF